MLLDVVLVRGYDVGCKVVQDLAHVCGTYRIVVEVVWFIMLFIK